MASTTVDAIERTVQKTNEWVAEMARELDTENREEAWRELRGYLHVLRDRLTVEETAHLGAQFTHLLRGVFYEGFDPTRQPEKIRDRDAFLARLAEEARTDPDQASRVAAAGTRVLRRHISEGEVDDVMSQLPDEIREVVEHG
jgi:uncharacterized protein (DUF2267 family)